MIILKTILLFAREIMDDKLAVILAVSIITLCAMWTFNAGAETIVTASISGLFGIAIGKKL